MTVQEALLFDDDVGCCNRRDRYHRIPRIWVYPSLETSTPFAAGQAIGPLRVDPCMWYPKTFIRVSRQLLPLEMETGRRAACAEPPVASTVAQFDGEHSLFPWERQEGQARPGHAARRPSKLDACFGGCPAAGSLFCPRPLRPRSHPQASQSAAATR